jgi:hypothetical protein
MRKSIWQHVNEGRKAVAALLIPGLTVLGAALLEGSPGGNSITASEWIAAIIASLGTSTPVWFIPNSTTPAPAPRATSDDPAAEPERYSDAWMAERQAPSAPSYDAGGTLPSGVSAVDGPLVEGPAGLMG